MRSKLHLLFALFLCVPLIGGCTAGRTLERVAQANGPEPILTGLLAILLLIVVAALFVLPLTHASWGEVVAVIVIVLLLLFYYTQPIGTWLSNLRLGASMGIANDAIPRLIAQLGSKLSKILFDVQHFILAHLPEKTITIGGFTILHLETRSLFKPTRWPLFILLIGGLIRVAVARYVKNVRLRHVTGEYWLYLLAYLVLAYVISAITNWSFLALVVAFALIFVALALGLLKVLGDILSAIRHILLDLWKVLRIGAKGVVYLVTIVTEFVKQFGRRVRELYQRVIVEPARRAQAVVDAFLSGIEQWLDRVLNRPPK